MDVPVEILRECQGEGQQLRAMGATYKRGQGQAVRRRQRRGIARDVP